MSLPLECPPLRTQPATQACALTGDRTGDPLIHWVAFNPLSYTSQGYVSFKLLFITYENADVIYSEDHGTSLPYVVLIQCFSKCGTSDIRAAVSASTGDFFEKCKFSSLIVDLQSQKFGG